MNGQIASSGRRDECRPPRDQAAGSQSRRHHRRGVTDEQHCDPEVVRVEVPSTPTARNGKSGSAQTIGHPIVPAPVDRISRDPDCEEDRGTEGSKDDRTFTLAPAP